MFPAFQNSVLISDGPMRHFPCAVLAKPETRRMTDLRAPYRRRKPHAGTGSYLPAFFVCIVAVVLGAYGWRWYQTQVLPPSTISRIQGASPASAATAHQVPATAPQRVPVVTTQSGYAYYAAESEPSLPEKTPMQRYDEALAVMEASRATQRRMDRQQYAPSTRVARANRDQCRYIEEAREQIHAAMRHPYSARQGERYRQLLRDNHAARIQAGC